MTQSICSRVQSWWTNHSRLDSQMWWHNFMKRYFVSYTRDTQIIFEVASTNGWCVSLIMEILHIKEISGIIADGYEGGYDSY